MIAIIISFSRNSRVIASCCVKDRGILWIGMFLMNSRIVCCRGGLRAISSHGLVIRALLLIRVRLMRVCMAIRRV